MPCFWRAKAGMAPSGRLAGHVGRRLPPLRWRVPTSVCRLLHSPSSGMRSEGGRRRYCMRHVKLMKRRWHLSTIRLTQTRLKLPSLVSCAPILQTLGHWWLYLPRGAWRGPGSCVGKQAADVCSNLRCGPLPGLMCTRLLEGQQVHSGSPSDSRREDLLFFCGG